MHLPGEPILAIDKSQTNTGAEIFVVIVINDSAYRSEVLK